MRLIAFSFTFIFSLASFGQSEEAFLHSKGYLIQGMSSLSLESNRTGWWRLSAPIAIKYGLEVSEGFDQRMDPVWSTKAAMEWWNDLYDQFEDSTLADDAFVNGPSHAQILNYDAITYLKWSRVYNEWKSMQMDSLPRFEGEPLKITGSLYWPDLKAVMGWGEADWKAFVEENPGIQDDHLAFNKEAYARFIQAPTVDQINAWQTLAEEKDSSSLSSLMASRNRIANDIPDPSSHERILHKVKSGEYLGTIAARYHVGLSELKKWNDLRSDMIRVGQELVIYAPKGRTTIAQTQTSTATQEGAVRSDEEDREEVKYKVKTGDTLWSIARNYPGISADDIMRWNGINEDIREGQELLILLPKSSSND